MGDLHHQRGIQRGPLRKSRLIGDAHMYKAVLQNDLLQDPEEGVNYFKNTQFLQKGSTNVYLYRLLSFFNHRRQNTELLIFTSKFEILLMSLMPVHTVQSPEFIASVRATPPDLLSTDNPEVLRQYLNGTQTRHKDAFPRSDNLIAQFFIIQSGLSDQQRERLISAMSLRTSRSRITPMR